MTAAVAQKASADDLRSHHLRPADMPWQKTRFPGCEFKPLLVDAKSGLATLLFKSGLATLLVIRQHGTRCHLEQQLRQPALGID